MPNLWKTPILGQAVFQIWRADARRKLELVRPWLKPTDRILEIGSGPGSVLYEFQRAGFQVDGLDISDNSFRETLRPIIYDGVQMPIESNAYDTALLLTVLHHTTDPDAILQEAARVAKRVIIIEDVFNSAWQRKYTKIADSITNLDFFGHPHSNRSDAEWRNTFEQMKLELVYGAVHRFAVLFRQAVYVVEAG